MVSTETFPSTEAFSSIPTSSSARPDARADKHGARKPPLPFRKPVVLHPDTHADRGLRRQADYRFSSCLNTAMLHVGEFLTAAGHYPLVFSEGTRPKPIAVLGLQRSTNAFVCESGHWRQGTYIPELIRCYPFLPIQACDGRQVLGIDDYCDRLDSIDNANVEPFFEADGTASKLSRAAVASCRRWQAGHSQTLEFAGALANVPDLLKPHSVLIRRAGEQRQVVGGFSMVDERVLRELPDEITLDWHRCGWLSLISFHLASQRNWRRLLNAESGSSRS